MEAGLVFCGEFFAEVDGDEVGGVVVGDVAGRNEVVGDGLGDVVEVPSPAAVPVEVESDTEGIWFSGGFFYPGGFVDKQERLYPFVVFPR